MDDIHLEDPRKFSAKQIQAAADKSDKQRSIWQYLFDLFVKTIICAAIISLDFTLFANAGNYNIFTTSAQPNAEAEYIYLGIIALSFVLVFAASFFRKLENAVPALCFALACVAIINQFATFEKHSGLLIIFNGIFSDGINAVLYEYSLWIIGGTAFILFWLFLNMLKRQFMLYFALALLAVPAWLLSEAYFNVSSQYFRTVAASPTLKDEKPGKNLVFLSFNNLTSPNNLAAMARISKKQVNIQESFNNSLGFFVGNDFILYPNALVENTQEPFLNLISSYNPDSTDDVSAHVQVSAIRDEYFIFNSLQNDRIYLKDSSLYNMLRKEDYTLHVYQTRGIDVCYLNNKLATALCMEKINSPIALSDSNFSTGEKTLLLLSQWLNSTGFVRSLNPVLKMAEFVLPQQMQTTMNFDAGRLYPVNSFKVFDQIMDNLERQTGNQAYFAIIDLPSETYMYNEFCQLKDMSEWLSESNLPFAKMANIDERRGAYADQVNCLFGALNSFIRRLDQTGYLENTTIIIEGLNTPQGLASVEKEYYRQLQQKDQVMLAIRPAGVQKGRIDYSVCGVKEILNSFFFTHKPCEEFSRIKTTDKNLKHIRQLIEADKYKKHIVSGAEKHFSEWVKAWNASNQPAGSNFGYSAAPEDEDALTPKNEQLSESKPKIIGEAPITDTVTEDVPEQKLQSISAAAEEAKQGETAENLQTDEVVPTGIQPVNEELPEQAPKDNTAVSKDGSTVSENKKNERSPSPEPIEIPAQEADQSAIEEPSAMPQEAKGNVSETQKPEPAANGKNDQEETAAADVPSAEAVLQNQSAEDDNTITADISEAQSLPLKNKENAVSKEKKSEENTPEKAKDENSPLNTQTIAVSDETTENEEQQNAAVSEPEASNTLIEGDVVIPDTLFDTAGEKDKAQEAIAKARKAVRAKEAEKAEKALDNLAENIETLTQSEEFKDVLEAPVAEGQKLSPEELKKQFHKNLQQAAEKAAGNVSIEVKVIEN